MITHKWNCYQLVTCQTTSIQKPPFLIAWIPPYTTMCPMYTTLFVVIQLPTRVIHPKLEPKFLLSNKISITDDEGPPEGTGLYGRATNGGECTLNRVTLWQLCPKAGMTPCVVRPMTPCVVRPMTPRMGATMLPQLSPGPSMPE